MLISWASRFPLGFTAISPLLTKVHPNRFTVLHCQSPRRCPQRVNITTATAGTDAPGSKKRVVFLGTPQVAAKSLQKLHKESASPSSTFTIAGVVTQPPAPVGRKRQMTKSPVHQMAETLSLEPVLTPVSASEPEFLAKMRDLQPDLCITAAYGNFLPSKFLNIPDCGTLNIHPSLLPAFRGAAPVPRALQMGVNETGVTILVTVLKMDAGPIIARCTRKLSGDERTPELLEELFDTGTQALLDLFPNVWDGTLSNQFQDDASSTHAPKIAKEEARLSFTENAVMVHNQVRAFAGWPGSWADFVLINDAGREEIRLKIGRTTVLRPDGVMCLGIHEVSFDEEKNCLAITCGDGSMIGLLEVQPPSKKSMDARSFWNGLRGKAIERKRVPH